MNFEAVNQSKLYGLASAVMKLAKEAGAAECLVEELTAAEGTEKLCRLAYDLGRSDATDDISGAWPIASFSMDRVRAAEKEDASG
jgi:hypothetical protein